MTTNFANQAEEYFAGFLESKGFVRRKSYWYEREMFEDDIVEEKNTTPDFCLMTGTEKMFIELKQLEPKRLPKISQFAHAISQEKVQKVMRNSFVKAKKQLKPYSVLNILMMIVLFDSTYEYLHDEFDISNLFGIQEFVFTSESSQSYNRLKRKGHELGPEEGLYISAVGLLQSYWDQPRLVVQPNPYATVTIPACFNLS